MQIIGMNKVQVKTRLGGKGDPLGIVQEIKICLHYQMYKAESVQKNAMHKILYDFEIKTDHFIAPIKARPSVKKKK